MNNIENELKPSLIGIITNPIEQFKRIKDAPYVWKPLLIVVALTIIGLWLTSKGVDISSLGDLTVEEIAAGKTFAFIGVVVIGLVTTIINVFVSTIIFFLFTKIMRAVVDFKQLFSMNTYIMLVTAISTIVNGLFIAVIGNYAENDPLYTSLAKYINVDGKLEVIFNNIEIFSIWTLVLTAIGLYHVAGISKRISWSIAILFFITGIFSGISG